MATKTDFTEQEWQVLQLAVVDTMTYLSMVDPGFWATFKEASGTARYMAGVKQAGPTQLVRDLASDIHAKRDDEISPANVEGATLDRVREALGIVTSKDEADVDPFKQFILGIASAAAEASEGVSQLESGALDKLRAALGMDA